MRKVVGMVAVLLLLSGCGSFDAASRLAFEQSQASAAALLALQGELESLPRVDSVTVDVTPLEDQMLYGGDAPSYGQLNVSVTMTDARISDFIEVSAVVRDAKSVGPLETPDAALSIANDGRAAVRVTEFIDDELLREALIHWFQVRAAVDPSLMLTVDHLYPRYDYTRTISAPADTPVITAAYVAAFPQISQITDVTLGMPVVELTGMRLVGELPSAEVMETFGRIIPTISLLALDYNPRQQGHVMLEWSYTPLEKSGAIYTVHAIQETDGGEEDLEAVAAELAVTAEGSTTLRSYLITRAGSVHFECERADAPFPDDLTLIEWLRARGIPVTVQENAGYCA